MDGIAKTMILLVIMGMLIYGLGAKAFSTDASTPPTSQPASLNDEPSSEVGDSNQAYSKLAELERMQEDIDYQLSQIDVERENLASSRAALEDEWSELSSEKELLKINQSAFESEKIEVAHEWEKLAAEQTSLREAQNELEQLRVELNKKEKNLNAENARLLSEMKRFQDEIADLKRTKYLLYGLAVVLVIASITIFMITRYYNKARLNAVTKNMTKDHLLLIPAYRKMAIQDARKQERINILNALRERNVKTVPIKNGNGREHEEIFVTEDIIMANF